MEPALILIDLQRDFFDASKIGNLYKASCLPGVRKLLALARDMEWLILHAITSHQGESTLPNYLRMIGIEPYCLEGSAGKEIVSGLVADGDHVIEKQAFSAFVGSDLEELLKETSSLVIAGVAADCCVLHTVFDAGTRYGKDVYIPVQAVAATSYSDLLFSLRIAAKSFGSVVDLEELLELGKVSPELRIAHKRLSGIIEGKVRPAYAKVDQLIADQPNLSTMPVERAIEILEEELYSSARA